MTRRDVERHLTEHGRQILREGARHQIWHNPTADARTPVPRHREIPTGTVRAICRQLRIPPPTGAR